MGKKLHHEQNQMSNWKNITTLHIISKGLIKAKQNLATHGNREIYTCVYTHIYS